VTSDRRTGALPAASDVLALRLQAGDPDIVQIDMGDVDPAVDALITLILNPHV
jgi:hypothetical protein